jgi:hypothetical protein
MPPPQVPPEVEMRTPLALRKRSKQIRLRADTRKAGAAERNDLTQEQFPTAN